MRKLVETVEVLAVVGMLNCAKLFRIRRKVAPKCCRRLSPACRCCFLGLVSSKQLATCFEAAAMVAAMKLRGWVAWRAVDPWTWPYLEFISYFTCRRNYCGYLLLLPFAPRPQTTPVSTDWKKTSPMDHGGQDQKPRLASNASEDWWTWRTWTWPAQLASAAYARATYLGLVFKLELIRAVPGCMHKSNIAQVHRRSRDVVVADASLDCSFCLQ
uniref:HDC14955 n=1 Tax=Drosophila melanogaster TaxID=7227 RepID=Q6IJG4_DROME|nr:TPA_inf: HDC14955 [Drosophila melanogaster]